MRMLEVFLLTTLLAGSVFADRGSQHRASNSGWGQHEPHATAQDRKPTYGARVSQLNWSNLNSGVCDELRDATPGLRLMCMAFCELQDCQPDYTLDNPLQNCSRSSQWILARYEARRGAGDPDMPCIKQPETSAECPCWTENELAGLRSGTPAYCFQNLNSGTDLVNFDSWMIMGSSSAGAFETSLSSAEVDSGAGGTASCALADSCADGNCLGVNRYQSITPAQFTACEAGVSQSIIDRGMDCTVMP